MYFRLVELTNSTAISTTTHKNTHIVLFLIVIRLSTLAHLNTVACTHWKPRPYPNTKQRQLCNQASLRTGVKIDRVVGARTMKCIFYRGLNVYTTSDKGMNKMHWHMNCSFFSANSLMKIFIWLTHCVTAE